MDWVELVGFVICYLLGLLVMWWGGQDKKREQYQAGYKEGYKDGQSTR